MSAIAAGKLQEAESGVEQARKKPAHRRRKNVGKLMGKYDRKQGDPRAAVHKAGAPSNQRLKRDLKSQESAFHQAAEAAARAEILLPAEQGFFEAANEMELQNRFSQEKLRPHLDVRTSSKMFSLELPQLGPYRVDYTREGKHLLLGGRKGHLAVLDWQAHKLVTELNVDETVRDVKFLHSHDMFAVAQKSGVYIYDQNGIELHCLRKFQEVNVMEYLPYHFLLASVGHSGRLRYLDTSLDRNNLVAEHDTKLGECNVMRQNPANAVMCLGHTNGTVSMWTPNQNQAVVQMFTHKAPLTALAVDSRGHYMVTAGMDAQVKVWDLRQNLAPLHSYGSFVPAHTLDISQTGQLAVGAGSHVRVWSGALAQKQRSPSTSAELPGWQLTELRFCPFEDVLGAAGSQGFSSLVVPGAGEANFDSYEANPFAGKKARREKLVHQLLEKLQPDTITLDPNMFGLMNRESKELYQGQSRERRELRAEQEQERSMAMNRARGRNNVRKRESRKRRNIVDEKSELRREQIMRDQEQQQQVKKRKLAGSDPDQPQQMDALARFKKRD